MKKGIVLAISVMMGLATTTVGLATITNMHIQTADARGQCRYTDTEALCSGGIGYGSGALIDPGGRGGHQEYNLYDGTETRAGGFGQPGSNEEGFNNGGRCDTAEHKCVGEGFNSSP